MDWINWLIWGTPAAILLAFWITIFIYVTGWLFWILAFVLTAATLIYAVVVAVIGNMTIA